MTTKQPQRYGGLLGVIGGVIGLGGWFAVATLTDFTPKADEAVKALSDDTNRILGSSQLLVIAAALVAAFGAILCERVRAAAPNSSLATMTAAGYALAGGALAISVVGVMGGALRVDNTDEISASQATTAFDFSFLMLGAVAPSMLALGVGAASVAALRFGAVLPAWLAWIGLPITVGLVILPISWAIAPVGLLWTIVAGVVLSSGTERVVDVTAGRVSEPAGV